MNFKRLSSVTSTFTVPMILAFGLTVSSAKADPVIPSDKTAHFGIAATATTICATLAKMISGNKWGSEAVCFLSVNAAGIAKEISDPYYMRTRDEKDIYANLMGSGLSIFMVSIGF